MLLLWAAGRDRASTLYVFDSFPGLCIIGLNLAAGALFVIFLVRTRRDERDEEKQHFYYLLGKSLCVWFQHADLLIDISATSPSQK